MSSRRYEYLSPEQVEQFLHEGWVVLRGAIAPQTVQEWTQHIFTRLGFDEKDPATWERPITHMPFHGRVPAAEVSPHAWGAMCELLGGEDRVHSCTWGDSFIVNLGSEADTETWQPPSPQSGGWHKDGDFFRHFLDSPEQGLLTIVLWSDVLPRGGATFIAKDSVAPVARYLAAHPEGVGPGEFHFGSLINECHHFAEATGEAGDVYLMHPYMLHASSKNALRRPRFITNPPASLKEPMQFNRSNPDDFSLVELAILRSLGVDRLDFQPTRPRERITPGSATRKQQMLEDEKARLAAAGVAA